MALQSAINFFKHISDSDDLQNRLKNIRNPDYTAFYDIALELGYSFTYNEFQQAYKYYWDSRWHLEDEENRSKIRRTW